MRAEPLPGDIRFPRNCGYPTLSTSMNYPRFGAFSGPFWCFKIENFYINLVKV